MSQDPHPFLRMQIFNFQVNHNNQYQLINLLDIKTQIEIKEKHRSARENIESNYKKYLFQVFFFFILIQFQNQLK